MSRPSRPNIKPAKKNLMYSTERINNLPASITKTIPPLGDKIIRFRLLNIRKDENGKWKVPFMKGIPSKDRIVDPATKKIYDIANIVRIGINDNPEIQTPFFTSGDAGRISINPQRAEDINLYEYLWISNYNASNPLRDKTKAAIYELEDESKDAERFLDKQAIRLSALQRVAVMSDDEVKVIGSQDTKTQKKLFKIYEKVKKHHEEYQSEVEILRLDNAQTDDKDCLLLTDKGEYKYSKEGIKKLTKDIESLNGQGKEQPIQKLLNELTIECLSKEFISFVSEKE